MHVEPKAGPGEAPPAPSPFPSSSGMRLLYGLFVSVVPAFSFFAVTALKPDYQSGKLSAYLVLSVSPEASLLFFPLLAFSIACYAYLLADLDRFARSFTVRLGVYTGVVLALQYTAYTLVYSLQDMAIGWWVLFLWFGPLVLAAGNRWTVKRWPRSRFLAAGTTTAVVSITLVLGFWVTSKPHPLALVVAVLVAGAPFWILLLSVRASAWILRHHETRLTPLRGLALLGWLGAWAAAWRYDVLKTLSLYAALPPDPPRCYIATAAAQGHPRFVGSRLVRLPDGRRMRVNRQLQVLKCAELSLLAVFPRLHRGLRAVYDTCGRPLARGIRQPVVADLAWLLLKPAEWLAGLALRALVPGSDRIARAVYTGARRADRRN